MTPKTLKNHPKKLLIISPVLARLPKWAPRTKILDHQKPRNAGMGFLVFRRNRLELILVMKILGRYEILEKSQRAHYLNAGIIRGRKSYVKIRYALTF